MAEITATMVKDLRDKTGAGMMDCKKALNETQGDMEGHRLAAQEGPVEGRQEGRPRRGRRPGRRGRGRHARRPRRSQFRNRLRRPQRAVQGVRRATRPSWRSKTAATWKSLLHAPIPGSGRDVQGELTNMIAKIGENMSVRRAASLSMSDGVVAGLRPQRRRAGSRQDRRAGRARSPTGDKAKLTALGQAARHACRRHQSAVAVRGRPRPGRVERERDVQAEIARQSGKPADIIEKMVEGRMRKFYEEIVLL